MALTQEHSFSPALGLCIRFSFNSIEFHILPFFFSTLLKVFLLFFIHTFFYPLYHHFDLYGHGSEEGRNAFGAKKDEWLEVVDGAQLNTGKKAEPPRTHRVVLNYSAYQILQQC